MEEVNTNDNQDKTHEELMNELIASMSALTDATAILQQSIINWHVSTISNKESEK